MVLGLTVQLQCIGVGVNLDSATVKGVPIDASEEFVSLDIIGTTGEATEALGFIVDKEPALCARIEGRR